MDNNFNNQQNMNNMPPYPNGQPMMGGQPVYPQQGMAQSVIPQPGAYDTQATMPQMAPQQMYINGAPMYQNQQPQQEYYQQPVNNAVPEPQAPKKSNLKIILIIVGVLVGLGIVGFVVSLIISASSVNNYIDSSRANAYVDTGMMYTKSAVRVMSKTGLDRLTDNTILIFIPVGHDNTKSCAQLESGGQSPYDATWKMTYVAAIYNEEKDSFDYYYTGVDGSNHGIKLVSLDELEKSDGSIVEEKLDNYALTLQDLYGEGLNLSKTPIEDLEDDDIMEFAYTVGAKSIVVLSRKNC